MIYDRMERVRFVFALYTRLTVILLIPVCFFALSRPTLGQDSARFSRLAFTISTGGDDLRGGNDNLNIGIHFRDGNVQWKLNVNGGRSWGNNSENTFHVDFSTPHDPSDLASIEFRTTFTGGTGGDNWDMASVSVRAIGVRTDQVIVSHGFYRFTGDDKSLIIPITMPSPGKANKLEFTIKTGNDDLRGDKDNLDLIIHYTDGATQLEKNINRGRNWPNGSTQTETITLNHAVEPRDIAKFELRTESWGVVGQDNWDMDSISIRAIGDGVSKIIAKSGFYRFTAIDRLSIPVTMPESGKANRLEFIFQTGNDDLRSDSSLDATIHFRNGHKQLVSRISAGQAWDNRSMHARTITLDQACDPTDIVGIDLEFVGFNNNALNTPDNWSMTSLTVKALGEGVDEIIFRHGFNRFKSGWGHNDAHMLRLRRDQ